MRQGLSYTIFVECSYYSRRPGQLQWWPGRKGQSDGLYEKADLLSAHLTETENGFNRKIWKMPCCLRLSDERGAGFGVTLPAEGPARVVTVLGRLDGPLPGESEAIVLHSLNRLNEHLTLAKFICRGRNALLLGALLRDRAL